MAERPATTKATGRCSTVEKVSTSSQNRLYVAFVVSCGGLTWAGTAATWRGHYTLATVLGAAGLGVTLCALAVGLWWIYAGEGSQE
jgi:hypothetical protein